MRGLCLEVRGVRRLSLGVRRLTLEVSGLVLRVNRLSLRVLGLSLDRSRVVPWNRVMPLEGC